MTSSLIGVDRQLLKMPDVAVIFFDRAVAREVAEEAMLMIAALAQRDLSSIEGIGLVAGFAIRIEVGEDEVLVAPVHDLIEDHAETVLVRLGTTGR
jgi:hypothetical protein